MHISNLFSFSRSNLLSKVNTSELSIPTTKDGIKDLKSTDEGSLYVENEIINPG